MKATGKQDRRGLLNLVLAVAFKSGIFQHLSVLLLKHKDFQSFASLVLPEGSPGARRRPASGRGPYLSIHPPAPSPTHPSTHPPSSPSSCLAQFGSPGLGRRGRGTGAWAGQRGEQGLCSRGAAGSETGDTQGCGGGGAEPVRAGTFGRPCPT